MLLGFLGAILIVWAMVESHAPGWAILAALGGVLIGRFITIEVVRARVRGRI